MTNGVTYMANMVYSEKVMEHFMNPQNVGTIGNPDGYGEVGNPVCGDLVEMSSVDRGVLS